MTDIKSGKIKSITESVGTGRGGAPWKRYLFEFEDGEKLSTFDAQIGEMFKPGQCVQMTGVQKGQYWNMITMFLAKETSPKQEELKAELKAESCLTNDLLRQILAELKRLK